MNTDFTNKYAISYPVLLGDIGGTNARFAILSDAQADLQLFETVKTIDFKTLAEAVNAAVLNKPGLMPRSGVLAIAGPVEGDEIPLTNSSWVICPQDLLQDLHLQDVILMNDFEALALALTSLEEEDLHLLGTAKLHQNHTKLVIGPGTGLGAAGLVHADPVWTPIPGEGGHMDLGPVREDEFSLWPFIEKEHGRISAEALLCGRGLVRLYTAITKQTNTTPSLFTPNAITAAALDKTDPSAEKAVLLFCRLLGRVAGDLALAFMAQGGVYLAGGISQKIVSLLVHSEFRKAFEAKAPHSHVMANIGTAVITRDKPALLGLAAFARTPQRFGMKLASRLWRA